MWEPQPLTTLRDSTPCTGITLPFHITSIIYLIMLIHEMDFLLNASIYLKITSAANHVKIKNREIST
jgi:hypothetical protein